MDARSGQSGAPAFHASGGEMGARIRSHDWAATPLGPIVSWPRTLQAVVALMLEMPQPACVCWGSDARFLYNDDYSKLLGTRHPDALARPFANVWPELADTLQSAIDATLAGKSERFVDQEVPRAGRGTGGAASWFTYTRTPLRDDTGRIGGFFCTGVETTHQVLAMRALRQSEKRFEADLSHSRLLQNVSAQLIENGSLDALYQKILDAAMAIMRADYATMQALRPERGGGGELELLASHGLTPEARQFWHWVTPASQSTCGAALRSHERVIVADVEVSGLLAGSEDLVTYLQTGIHAVQTTPLVSRSGELLGMISTHWREPHEPTERDLTTLDILARQAADLIERRRSEEAQVAALLLAEEAARSREEFLSIASQELRNPVATLYGTTQLLRRARASGRLTDARLGAYIESLELAGAHLAALTNDLLDVSRIQRGELPLRPETTDIAKLLRDSVRGNEWPHHQVILAGVDEPVEVVIDAGRIRQVVTNLLENAVKYSPSAQEVRVQLRPDDAGVMIEVQDFGIGLPMDALDSIFTPFRRAPNASEAGIPGLGLGLFIARRIAEQHGGRLLARSEGEGRGTVMALWLPTRPRDAREGQTDGADHA